MTDRRTKAQLANVLKYQAGVIDRKNEEITALKQCLILMSRQLEITNPRVVGKPYEMKKGEEE